MCGPSGAMKGLASSTSSFFQNLMASYNQVFGGQQGILSGIRSALEPILNAGPNQEGFDASTMADLRGRAINSSAAANRNAQVVAGSSVGGNTGVETGGQKQLEAQIASNVGTNLSNEENNINLTSKQIGRENFFNAETGLAGAASLENPVAYAGAANNSGGMAFNEETHIQDMRNQEQADVGGAVAGLALAPFTGGMSLGGLKGLFGGGGNSDAEMFGDTVG